jgi:hypothetical protein
MSRGAAPRDQAQTVYAVEDPAACTAQQSMAYYAISDTSTTRGGSSCSAEQGRPLAAHGATGASETFTSEDRRHQREPSDAAWGSDVHKTRTPHGRRTWAATSSSRPAPAGIRIIGWVVGEADHARSVGIHDVDFAVGAGVGAEG